LEVGIIFIGRAVYVMFLLFTQQQNTVADSKEHTKKETRERYRSRIQEYRNTGSVIGNCHETKKKESGIY